jgi:hypothetical protein
MVCLFWLAWLVARAIAWHKHIDSLLSQGPAQREGLGFLCHVFTAAKWQGCVVSAETPQNPACFGQLNQLSLGFCARPCRSLNPIKDATPGRRAALLLWCEVVCLLFLYGFVVAAACLAADPGAHSITPSVLAVCLPATPTRPCDRVSGFKNGPTIDP